MSYASLRTGNLGLMKVALALILILLVAVIVLPIGMSEMGDCPMCTSPKTIALGICAGILALFILIVQFRSSRLRSVDGSYCPLFLTRSIYRPPRLA